MKNKAKELFLYKHRFVIGYIVIGLIFLALLSVLPLIVPGGLSNEEMNSAVIADSLDRNFIKEGSVVNLPYYAVQKLCLKIFGLSLYTIKIPSILFGAATAFFLVLLLNRWFKSDVALISSALTTLSTAFLCLANFSTPTIMYVFWIAFILWAGSKIVGNDEVKPWLIILFTSAVGFSLYTPYLCYIALIILAAGIIHPSLRSSLKKLNIYEFFIMIFIFAIALCPLVVSVVFHPELIKSLAFMDGFTIKTFLNNINSAFAPFFSFSLAYDSIYLAPLFGLGTVALIIMGALASLDNIKTAKNLLTLLMIFFAILISGLDQTSAALVIVPVAILTANAIETITTRWKNMFPNNPYAHVVGAFPLVVIIYIILVSSFSHYVQGYHYTPRVTKNFSNDITIIRNNLSENDTLIVSADNENLAFYQLLAKHRNFTVLNEIPEKPANDRFIMLEKTADKENFELDKIVVSQKSRNSDRLYIYTKTTEQKESGE